MTEPSIRAGGVRGEGRVKHVTRYSDSSLYDEVCTVCGATDATILGEPDQLSGPCPGPAWPSIRAAYGEACPGIAGRILTAHEAAEADAMRAALVEMLLHEADVHALDHRIAVAGGRARDSLMHATRAAWATVLALLLAPDAHL